MITSILKRFLPLAFLTTALCGLVYIAVQQDIRQSANDPQIQMAEDAAAQLSVGATGTSTVDIANSLAPYMVVFDDSGAPIAGNGNLNGSLPHLPLGVFAYTATAGEDRFTWQPTPGVRQAVVLVRVDNPSGTASFIMAGRSLREVEIRENKLETEVGGVWFFAIGGLLILEILAKLISI